MAAGFDFSQPANRFVRRRYGASYNGTHVADPDHRRGRVYRQSPVRALLAAGHQVTAIDDLSTGKLANIATCVGHPDSQFVRETILNAQVLDRLCSQADLVIHLAAAVGVKLIVEDPVHTINTNVTGTEAVLTTANRYGCKVLLASTSEVYGKGVRSAFPRRR